MRQFGAGLLVNGESIEWWAAEEVFSFDEGATVTISGNFNAIGDLLFWGFGQSETTVYTDDDQTIVLKAGFNDELGMVVVAFVDDEPVESYGSFLPWRAE